MKKLIAIVLIVTLMASLGGASVVWAAEGGNNSGEISIASGTHYITDEGWAKYKTSVYDCYCPDWEGWADDEWELTVTLPGYLTVTVEDGFLVGDYFEIWIDGVLEYTTPDPGCKTTNPLSVGSVTVLLNPGVHTIKVRDALDFCECTGMCSAGLWVTGVWEPVVEFTKEIISYKEGGDMDGRLEPGEDWEWTFEVNIKNLTDQTITVEKLHDRLGGDLEWEVIAWYSGLIGEIDWYTKGKTEKVFINFYDGFSLAAGQEEWLFSVSVSPDINTGKGTANNPDKNGNKNPKNGHQEYTSTGEHCLNSGAWFEGWIGGEYIEASTNPVCVEVLEAD